MSRHPKRYSAKSLTEEQKTWFGKEIHQRRQTAKELATQCQIPYSTLQRYASSVASGKVMHDKCGRPAILSPNEEKKLVSFLNTPDNKICTPKFNEKLQEPPQNVA